MEKYKVTKNIKDVKWFLGYESGKILVIEFGGKLMNLKLKNIYQKKNSFNIKRTFNGLFENELKNNLRIFQLFLDKKYDQQSG